MPVALQKQISQCLFLLNGCRSQHIIYSVQVRFACIFSIQIQNFIQNEVHMIGGRHTMSDDSCPQQQAAGQWGTYWPEGKG